MVKDEVYNFLPAVDLEPSSIEQPGAKTVFGDLLLVTL